MTGLVSVLAYDPQLVGWVAALAVLLFLAISFLLLVVGTGGDDLPLRSAEDELPVVAPSRVRDPEPIALEQSDPAAEYAAGLAASMRGMAIEVVDRAQLRPGERILDAATGRMVGASRAMLSGIAVLDVDPSRAGLAIAPPVPGRPAGDPAPLPLPAGWCNVVLSVHSLQFDADPTATLAEWRRVTGPRGRLSLSVPGPRAALGLKRYDPIYRRHGVKRELQVPTPGKLSTWATAAGWLEVEVVADPGTVIRLAGADDFRTWMQTRSLPGIGDALSAAQVEALEDELLAATPVARDGQLVMPFGTLYMTARNR